jgi:polysaccharide biosynthesis transport protein
MLKVDQSLISDEPSPKAAGPKVAAPDNYYVRVLRHQLPTVIVFMVLIMALAIIYLFVTVPVYVSTAYMVIDTRQMQLLQDPQEARGNVNVDAGMVSTQIQLLKSQNVSRAVIEKLKLTEDPEFDPPPSLIGSVIGRVSSLFTPAPPPLPDEERKSRRLRKVQANFENQRTVTRVEQSFVMEIDAQSANAKKAARIANAIPEAYIDDILESKYQETQRANVWLQERLKELRAQLSAEQQAVVAFRKEHDISYSDTGGGKFYVDTPGKLVSEQQLGELNSQLILAAAATAQEKARYEARGLHGHSGHEQ